MRVAFDWDGTLVDHRVKPNYDDSRLLAAHTLPNVPALLRAKRLLGNGYDLHIVTGRGPHVGEVTLNQVRLFLDADFPKNRLHLQPKWTSYDALRSWKAGILRSLNPILYVGDHSCDLGAASDASVPFMEAQSFRVGHKLPAFLHEPELVA